jgi:hypothetical protein
MPTYGADVLYGLANGWTVAGHFRSKYLQAGAWFGTRLPRFPVIDWYFMQRADALCCWRNSHWRHFTQVAPFGPVPPKCAMPAKDCRASLSAGASVKTLSFKIVMLISVAKTAAAALDFEHEGIDVEIETGFGWRASQRHRGLDLFRRRKTS